MCERLRRGPHLRFTTTFKGWSEDGRTPAWSTPGFRAIRDENGDVKVCPPIRHVSATKTVYVCQISTDMAEWILDALRETEYWDKIGKNYDLKAILDLPDDLSMDMPEGVVLY